MRVTPQTEPVVGELRGCCRVGMILPRQQVLLALLLSHVFCIALVWPTLLFLWASAVGHGHLQPARSPRQGATSRQTSSICS